MSDSDDIMSFLKTWQSLLNAVAIAGCVFTEDQQVNLLLAVLPDSCSAFITTQGGIANLTFSTLLSNTLQQNSINISKPETSKSNVFYVKGKFIKPSSNQFNFSRQFPKNNKQSYRSQFQYNEKSLSRQKPTDQHTNSSTRRIIVCHYCGIPGHKFPECRKRKRDQAKNEHNQVNNALITQTIRIPTTDTPDYLFLAIYDNSGLPHHGI
jgi:hypothetical protein